VLRVRRVLKGAAGAGADGASVLNGAGPGSATGAESTVSTKPHRTGPVPIVKTPVRAAGD